MDFLKRAGSLFTILALIFIFRAEAEDKTDTLTTSGNNVAVTEPLTKASVVTQDQDIKQIDTVVQETKDILKEKEQKVDEVKKEAEKIIEEKNQIEQEAKLKGEAASVAKQEAELLKKEAEITKDKSLLKKSKALEKEARKLEDEVDMYNERLSVAESKAQVALQEIASKQEKIDNLKKTLENLKKEKAARKDLLLKLLEMVGIISGGILLIFILRVLLKGIERFYTPKYSIRESEVTLRIRTVSKVFYWAASMLISLMTLVMVLENFGISVAPLLAGAGIVGIAVGFGGQYLIRDVINGFFILMEGQYNINDVIKVGEFGGLVEDINLRLTILRDLEGRVIYIPNGEIKTVVNFTKDYAHALIDLGVAYKENVDKVIKVIKDIGAEMRADEYFGKLILEDLEMLGVDDFSDSAVIIKFRIKTLPIKQWDVSREFRRRIKNRFDELGIEIPFPHRTLYWGVPPGKSEVKENTIQAEKAAGKREKKEEV